MRRVVTQLFKPGELLVVVQKIPEVQVAGCRSPMWDFPGPARLLDVGVGEISTLSPFQL